jgi:hypothetical protein
MSDLLKQLAERHKQELADAKATLLAEEAFSKAKQKADTTLSDALSKAKEAYAVAKEKAEQAHAKAIAQAKAVRDSAMPAKPKKERKQDVDTRSATHHDQA